MHPGCMHPGCMHGVRGAWRTPRPCGLERLPRRLRLPHQPLLQHQSVLQPHVLLHHLLLLCLLRSLRPLRSSASTQIPMTTRSASCPLLLPPRRPYRHPYRHPRQRQRPLASGRRERMVGGAWLPGCGLCAAAASLWRMGRRSRVCSRAPSGMATIQQSSVPSALHPLQPAPTLRGKCIRWTSGPCDSCN